MPKSKAAAPCLICEEVVLGGGLCATCGRAYDACVEQVPDGAPDNGWWTVLAFVAERARGVDRVRTKRLPPMQVTLGAFETADLLRELAKRCGVSIALGRKSV